MRTISSQAVVRRAPRRRRTMSTMLSTHTMASATAIVPHTTFIAPPVAGSCMDEIPSHSSSRPQGARAMARAGEGRGCPHVLVARRGGAGGTIERAPGNTPGRGAGRARRTPPEPQIGKHRSASYYAGSSGRTPPERREWSRPRAGSTRGGRAPATLGIAPPALGTTWLEPRGPRRAFGPRAAPTPRCLNLGR